MSKLYGSVFTDNESRDKHLKGPDFFDSNNSKWHLSVKHGKQRWLHSSGGTLTIHGVSNDIAVTMVQTGWRRPMRAPVLGFAPLLPSTARTMVWPIWRMVSIPMLILYSQLKLYKKSKSWRLWKFVKAICKRKPNTTMFSKKITMFKCSLWNVPNPMHKEDWSISGTCHDYFC